MFRFEDPSYLYVLVVLPILALLFFYSNFLRRRRIRRYGDPELMARLMPEVSLWRPRVKFWLLLAALGCAIIMLARPQFGMKTQKVKRNGIEVIIAMDISNSMLAQDVTPSRLDRAKMLVSKMIDEFDQDKIGLIVFAGNAFTQMPITSDYISAKMFLSSINPGMIQEQGTAIGDAISLASKSFTPQKGVGKAIIVITDGENHEPGAAEAAEAARKKGYVVDVLGIGSTKGAPIPMGNGKYLTDRSGQTVVTHLDESMCKEIADAGKGIYAHVDNSDGAQQALHNEINKLAKSESESQYSEYDEQFQGFAMIIIILLVAEIVLLEKKNPLFKNIKLFSKK
jgi:Ca-activated chloride channel homolog